MTTTTVTVGTTGQCLEGLLVGGAIRESVVLSDPLVSDAFAEIVSSQPIQAYGMPVWVQGTPNVAVSGALPSLSGTTQVFGQTSTQIVSSIPFYVSQSSAPWEMNGGVAVTNTPNVSVTALPDIRGGVAVTNTVAASLVGTSQVFGIVSTQIISSIPFYVSQSSSPWTINGAINISSQTAVSSSWPLGTTMVQVVSSAIQNIQGTSSVNVLGSIPSTSFVSISSSIPLNVTGTSYVFAYPLTSTAGGVNCTTVILKAHLNTTVIKAGPGQLYGYQISNLGSTTAYIKLANASSAVIASTAKFQCVIGLPVSSVANMTFPVGVTYSTGITMFTTQKPWLTDLTAVLASTVAVNLQYQ